MLLDRLLHPKPSDAQAMPTYSVGQVMAEQAAQVLHDQGRCVLVCLPLDSVRSQAELEGFQHTFDKFKHLTLTATKKFKPEETGMGRLSFEQFAALVKEYSSADLIVCMLRINSFTDSQIASLPRPCPKLVVMDWNPADVQRGLNAGLVKAAVMSRQLTALPTDNPRNPHEWFDRYYNLVTAESSGISK